MSFDWKNLSEKLSNKVRKKRQPKFEKPMLAKLTKKRFSKKDWIYERKLDGERALVSKKGKKIYLMSRNRKTLNDTYPEIVDELKKQRGENFIADGEIVAFRGNVTSFERLQKRMQIKDPKEARKTNVAVYYYLFDILHAEGHDVTKLPLRVRKKILNATVSSIKHIRILPHKNKEGEKYYKKACKKRWEGLIAKDAKSKYLHSRSSNWLKFKCVNRQELVIGGFTDPKGSRKYFGALLVGYYKKGKLKYAGKIGTGYDEDTLKSLGKKMKKIEQNEPPFSDKHLPKKNVHWVKPKLVAEIGFTEWTDEGKLRHPRYLGLRDDKKAKNVKREKPSA